ncbi:MAG: DUF1302 domain-containing protein [Gammaproteobacteria bacterium]|nr:DUF1302 domain-containing protein [Gammaproteobacteria bacterium]
MTRLLVRPLLRVLASASAVAACAPASALEIDVADVNIKIENLFTVGAMWRTEGRDPTLIAKTNLPGQKGLCVSRVGDDGVGGPGAEGTNTFQGTTCTTSILAENEKYVNAQGSYAINGDDGNLAFDKGDIVHANAKLTSDISFSLGDYNFFARTIWFFDDQYVDHELVHPDTTLIQAREKLSPLGTSQLGTDFDVLDYYVSGTLPLGELLGDREVSFKLGNQVLNWGESAFLLVNSLNTINAPDQSRLRVPGFDVKELLQPAGMLVLGTEIVENLNTEVFYKYEWKPLIPDPVGSFFSVSDVLGAGGRFAMLSFGKAPEDPGNVYRARENSQDPVQTLGSRAGRTVYRDLDEEKRRLPSDGGQYGAALKLFLEDFNNGTELGFYFANYHSYVPSVSFIAAGDGCLPNDTGGGPGANLLATLAACQFTPRPDSPGDLDYPADGRDPLPVDEAKLFIEYPENVKLYGASFNTTVGDWAWAGEFAYRPNLPVQIHTVDLTLAAVSPAFPETDLNIGASVIPSERSATANFVAVYRGNEGNLIQPGQYIRGYERLKVGQFGTTLLRLIGGDNPINASQITFLLEMGATQVFDMPGLDELQFNGAGADTHISHGADGTRGIQPADLRTGQISSPDDGDGCASASTPVASVDNINPRCMRQNPAAQKLENFPTDLSYGYRLVFLPRWDSALFGANIEWLSGFFHDVDGITPGIGGNFVEGRKQILQGLRFDYLSKFIGEVRYTWFTGGGDRDALRDRDNVFITLGYQF